MHIGFMIQNESMLPHGKLLMQSLEKTKYESVRMMVPEMEMDLVQELRAVYPEPKILVTPFSIPERYRKFPFADKLVGAAVAESLVEGTLLWMDTDSIAFQDLSSLELKEETVFAYRPVDKKLVGCEDGEPLTAFWQQIYNAFELEDEFSPMKTGVEELEIRPYFNAGFFILRTERGILQFWRDRFFTIIEHEEMHHYFEEHVLFKIFIHQAVLTGAVLASTTADERQLLPGTVNYPIYFHDQHPIHDSVCTSNDLISCRYDTYFNQEPEEQNFPFSESMKPWIDAEVLKLGWFYE